MLEWYQALILAIVQGLTEFLPISSSAHLIFPSLLFGWPDQGLDFDVAVHVGTLLAVLVFYRRDLQTMAYSWTGSLLGREADESSRLVWYLMVATIPVGLVGVLGGEFIETHLRNLPVMAATSLIFGLLLGVADHRANRISSVVTLTLTVAVLIGLAQAIAPIPGVSRSGITMTAALLLGMSRQASARFSFLLSIPVIASAGILKGWELYNSGGDSNWALLALGALVSAITAYLCIALFLRLLDRVGLMPFVYYRLILAVVLLLLWVN